MHRNPPPPLRTCEKATICEVEVVREGAQGQAGALYWRPLRRA